VSIQPTCEATEKASQQDFGLFACKGFFKLIRIGCACAYWNLYILYHSSCRRGCSMRFRFSI